MMKLEELLEAKLITYALDLTLPSAKPYHILAVDVAKDFCSQAKLGGISLKELLEKLDETGGMLAIIDIDARLPIRFLHPDDKPNISYALGREDMRKANFKRVIWQGGQE